MQLKGQRQNDNKCPLPMAAHESGNTRQRLVLLPSLEILVGTLTSRIHYSVFFLLTLRSFPSGANENKNASDVS